MTTDERYMKEALRQAEKAKKLGEVPIGCVIVKDDQIIARGYNRRNTDKNTLSHAELNAIRKASKVLGDWRLEDCTMYITLEPCQMCSGAIVQSRIKRVVLGSMNPKAGCAGSILNMLQVEAFNHQVEITKDVLKEECSQILSDFFRELREEKQKKQLPKSFLSRLRGELPGYTVVKGSEENLDDIYELMRGNTCHNQQIYGREVLMEECMESLTGRPEGTTPEQKTFAVLYKKGKCTALVDFIYGYPDEKTCYLGLLMLAEEAHFKGIGKKLMKHVYRAAKAVGMESMRLVCYECNEIGMNFWKKQGFELLGELEREVEGRSLRLYELEKVL